MMKRIILSVLLGVGFAGVAYAQIATTPTTMPVAVSFAGDIRKQGDNYIEMRSGRTYYVEDNMVIERVAIDAASMNFYNVFDFENEIVFHKTDSNNLGLIHSPFSAISQKRLKDVKDYGCYVSKGAAIGGARSSDPRASFYLKYCSS